MSCTRSSRATRREIREYHEESLRTADGVVIFYRRGPTSLAAPQVQRTEEDSGYGRTKPAPVVAVCLLPPKTPDKERFRAHEAIVIPQWDGLSPDPWLPIIARLKG